MTWFLFVCGVLSSPYIKMSLPVVTPLVRYPDEAVCRAALAGGRELDSHHPGRCSSEDPGEVAKAVAACAEDLRVAESKGCC